MTRLVLVSVSTTQLVLSGHNQFLSTESSVRIKIDTELVLRNTHGTEVLLIVRLGRRIVRSIVSEEEQHEAATV